MLLSIRTICGIDLCCITTHSISTPDDSQPATPDFLKQSKNYTTIAIIEIIDKLRQFGLTDEQIAEALNLPLNEIDLVDLEE